MTEIRGGRDISLEFRSELREVQHDRRQLDDMVRDLVKDLQKDKARVATELAKLDVRELSQGAQQQLGQMLARELRGQLPAPLAQALAAATVGPDMLQNLLQRMANSASNDQSSRLAQAATPDAARAQAADGAVPQQALRWTQFVQRTTHVPGSQMQDRAGTATPKGEMATLLELIGQHAKGTGAGLKTPKLVERSLADLSPGQKTTLMQATFGSKVAGRLMELGISDPLSFVKAGAMPQGRAALAEALGMDRGKLLGLLMRTELLKVGAGRNGEMGIRPDLLGPLQDAGIAMLGTMAALRSMSREEVSYLYTLLRKAAGGFASAMKGSRPPVKRDLAHWARTAARRPSDILLADNEERQGPLTRGDAQELIQAWYLENLLWETLARKRDELMRERERREKEDRERSEEREGGGNGNGNDGGDDGRGGEPDSLDDGLPELEYDSQREDKLICFWITDFNTDPSLPESERRMYVCIDPDTGAILPQQVEAEIQPSHRLR